MLDVVRDRAPLARQTGDGEVGNVYRLQIMNTTERPQRYRISADGLPGLKVLDARPVQVAPTEAQWVSVTLRVPPQTADRSRHRGRRACGAVPDRAHGARRRRGPHAAREIHLRAAALRTVPTQQPAPWPHRHP
jgi:IG-like fold at C-terminal of FixG, putative oxidoreductase